MIVAPLPSPDAPMALATPTVTRAPWRPRLQLMAEIGLAMMVHAKLKLAGTLAGVVSATLLINFALGTFFGLLARHTMLPKNANADLWIVPRGAEIVGQGTLDVYALHVARTTPGVVEAAPILMGALNVTTPEGRHEGVSLVGTPYPYRLAGPWNVIAGEVGVLRHPDTLIVESSVRESLGGLNVGSVREMAGRRTVIGGFTWGLAGLGASYAFADYETAREYLHVPRDRASFVLVRVERGRVDDVAATLRARLADADVYPTPSFLSKGYRQLLTKTPIGVTFGAIALFGLAVGTVVVGLSMFSAVVDNLHEFGLLKALGCTNGDLSLLLLAQAVAYGVFGSALGLALVGLVARALRSPNMSLELPWQLPAATVVLMLLMCGAASLLSLARLWKVEPAMVFR
jgi:putative ABC transport system permease protein